MSEENSVVDELFTDGTQQDDHSQDNEVKETDTSSVEQETETASPGEESQDDSDNNQDSKQKQEQEVNVDDVVKERDQLKNENKNLKKRVKDNQRSFHTDRVKLRELEEKLEKMKTAQSANNDEDDDGGFFDDDEDDEKAIPGKDDKKSESESSIAEVERQINEVKEGISQKEQEQEQEQFRAEWEAKEQSFIEKNDVKDYSELVYGKLVPLFESTPGLVDRYKKMGATPEAAYKLAQEVTRQENPDAYKQSVRESVMEELKNEGKLVDEPVRSPGDPAGNSMAPVADVSSDTGDSSVVNELFG